MMIVMLLSTGGIPLMGLGPGQDQRRNGHRAKTMQYTHYCAKGSGCHLPSSRWETQPLWVSRL